MEKSRKQVLQGFRCSPAGRVALRQGLHHTGEAGESLSECGQQARAAGSCCRKVDIVHLPFRSTSWPPGECAFSQLMDTLSPGHPFLGLLLQSPKLYCCRLYFKFITQSVSIVIILKHSSWVTSLLKSLAWLPSSVEEGPHLLAWHSKLSIL